MGNKSIVIRMEYRRFLWQDP